MKAFVTGGTGFIGSHLLRQLLRKGHTVTGLARSDQGASQLRAMGVQVVRGDINDRTSLQSGIEGVDVVFHLAGWYGLSARDPDEVDKINVQGTQNVLEVAHQAGVPRILHTSTVAVFGDTHGKIVDETYFYPGPHLTDYDRSKWMAHYQVALPMIQQGAPIIIAMPGVLHGPGDQSIMADLMRRFYQGQFLLFPGPETGSTLTHVEDIAMGMILAVERGEIGETYILAGPCIRYRELIEMWSRLTGMPQPLAYIPAAWLRPWAPWMAWLGQTIPLPALFSSEAMRSMGATYFASARKAQLELGWQPRELEAGVQETLTWIAHTTSSWTPFYTRERQVAGVSLMAAILLTMFWLLTRKRRR